MKNFPFLSWHPLLHPLSSIPSSFSLLTGSGVAEVKCVMNGVDVPHFFRLRTLICKVLSLIFAVSSGLVIGKEGPMIHRWECGWRKRREKGAEKRRKERNGKFFIKLEKMINKRSYKVKVVPLSLLPLQSHVRFNRPTASRLP